METCVLIPKEFSLVLTNDQSSCKNLFKNESNTLAVRISVWSNVFIPSGTLIYPFQGSIRFDKIDLYSLLDDNDVSINTLHISYINIIHNFIFKNFSII